MSPSNTCFGSEFVTKCRAASAAFQYDTPREPRRGEDSSPDTVSVGMTTICVGSPGARSTAVPGRSPSPRSTARQGKVRLASLLASTQVLSAIHSTSRVGSDPAEAG